MIRYFKMKKKEIALKLAFYSFIEEFANEKEDIIITIKNLYLALKDVPINELQDVFMEKLAEIIHYDTHNEKGKSHD